jgi:hypothetical protein
VIGADTRPSRSERWCQQTPVSVPSCSAAPARVAASVHGPEPESRRLSGREGVISSSLNSSSARNYILAYN